MTTPDLQAFHVGIVVKDMTQTMEQYGALFDIDHWFRAKHRFNGLEIGYGLGPGISIELFEVTGPGETHIHQFFDETGEGVNHIGFWSEDIAATARKAIDAGAELVSITADAEGNATAQFIPPPSVNAEHFADLGIAAFVRPVGNVLFEYVGPVGEAAMRDAFAENFDRLVEGPPWSR